MIRKLLPFLCVAGLSAMQMACTGSCGQYASGTFGQDGELIVEPEQSTPSSATLFASFSSADMMLDGSGVAILDCETGIASSAIVTADYSDGRYLEARGTPLLSGSGSWSGLVFAYRGDDRFPTQLGIEEGQWFLE